MERETGGMLQPLEMFTKTRERVMDVLSTKHPDSRLPTVSSLDTYPDLPPELVPVDITDYKVMEVAGQLSRGAGSGGGGLSEPPELSPEFRSGKQGAAADCCRLCVVVRQRAVPMIRLLSYDEIPADCTGQAARGRAGQGRGNLAAADVKVCTVGEGSGGQGILRDISASRWC